MDAMLNVVDTFPVDKIIFAENFNKSNAIWETYESTNEYEESIELNL